MRFAPLNYFQARDNFKEKAKQKGLALDSILVPFAGPMGEDLTIDLAYHQPPISKSVLIHTSGAHGVEGFAGSAIQQEILENLDLRAFPDTSLIFIHCINPYGMSWLRRANGNNVDLNRSYFGTTERPHNRFYKYFDSMLNPKTTVQKLTGIAHGMTSRVSFGKEISVQAIAQGQYEFPQGLFYGAREIQPESAALLKKLKVLLRGYEKVFVMEVHTGLGGFDEELLFGGIENAYSEINLMKEAFGKSFDVQDATVGGYSVYGELSGLYRDAAPHARIGYVIQEFGTYGNIDVLKALRDENFDYHFGEGKKNAVTKSKVRLKNSFFPENGKWRNRVLKQGVTRFRQLALLI
ncbi:MAG: DUF2817 domain-containing protein [Pseudobdellovibrionaceae bacterium]